MSRGWRGFALVAAGLLGVCGIVLWSFGGGLFLLIFAAVVVVTALLEPVYGLANGKPHGAGWRSTDERFIDPESGKLVTVWFDSATGQRRYVTDDEPSPT